MASYYYKTKKIDTLVKDKGEVSEDIIYNVIDLLSIEETSVFQYPFSILEFGNDVIVCYPSLNSLSQNCKSFSVYNKLDKSNKRIHLENIEVYNKHGYLIIKNVTDYVTWNPETAILSHYTDVDSVVKRKVTTFNNTTHFNINDKTKNNISAIYVSPFRTGINQLINNENQLYVINSFGAIEEQNGRLSRIDYDQYNFPFVYVQQVLNAPTGLFYLLKE